MSKQKNIKVAILGAGASGLGTFKALDDMGVNDITIYNFPKQLQEKMQTWFQESSVGLKYYQQNK